MTKSQSQLCNSGERTSTALTGLARFLYTQVEMSRVSVQHSVQRKCLWSYLTSASLKQTKNTRQAAFVLKNEDKGRYLPRCKVVWSTMLSNWQKHEKENAFFMTGTGIGSWSSTYNLSSSTQEEVILCFCAIWPWPSQAQLVHMRYCSQSLKFLIN